MWIARTGSPWRDLPVRFGDRSTAFQRFRDGRAADAFKRIFDALADEPDLEYAMVAAAIAKVHRHGQGAKGGPKARPLSLQMRHDGQYPGADQCAGRFGALQPDVRTASRQRRGAPLIDGIACDGLIADNALDGNAFVAELNERGAKASSPSAPVGRKFKIDTEIYTWRHLIENFFCKLKDQAHHHARLQNPPQLHGHDLPRPRCRQLTVNPHKP